MFRLHIDCPSWARFWFFETLNSVICLRIRLRKIPYNIHTQALSWFKKGVLIPITVIFYAEMMPAFEFIIQPTITFQLCTFFENLCSKTTSCLAFFFFLTSIIEITTWGEGLHKCDVCLIILAPDYKGNLTTVNSLWKSFLIQPIEHQGHQVQNIRIKSDLTSMMVWVLLTLSLLN